MTTDYQAEAEIEWWRINAQLIAMGEATIHSDRQATRIHIGDGIIFINPEHGGMWAQDVKGEYVNVAGKWHHQKTGSGTGPSVPVPETLAQRLEAASLQALDARDAYRAKLEGAQS